MKFFLDESNRELISWLGGGAVVVISGAWTLFTYLRDNKKPKKPAAPGVVVNSGGGAVIAPGATIHGSLNMFNEEKNREQIANELAPLKKQLEDLNREKGIPTPVVEAALVKMQVTGVTAENAPAKFNEVAENYERLTRQLAWMKQHEPDLAARAEQAQALLDRGDFNNLSRLVALLLEQNEDYQAAQVVPDERLLDEDERKKQLERWKILQDTQDAIFSMRRDTVEPSSDAYKKWDKYIRSSD
jgi:hypothetical protein